MKSTIIRIPKMLEYIQPLQPSSHGDTNANKDDRARGTKVKMLWRDEWMDGRMEDERDSGVSMT